MMPHDENYTVIMNDKGNRIRKLSFLIRPMVNSSHRLTETTQLLLSLESSARNRFLGPVSD